MLEAGRACNSARGAERLGRARGGRRLNAASENDCRRLSRFQYSRFSFAAAQLRDPTVPGDREEIMSYPIKAFFADETAATAIEYALIASLIALGIVAALNALTVKIDNTFSEVTGNLK
jgi:pilus assembly protein Flp/PilA